MVFSQQYVAGVRSARVKGMLERARKKAKSSLNEGISRVVRRGGVDFIENRYGHEQLNEFEGKQVWVFSSANDNSSIDVYSMSFIFICTANLVTSKKIGE